MQGRFVPQQKELLKRIFAKRARGLPVTGLWCRIIMKNFVKDLPKTKETEKFVASDKWFFDFRKRWGLSFQEKTNVKRKSVEARLPYVRKHHQYILYSAFKELP